MTCHGYVRTAPNSPKLPPKARLSINIYKHIGRCRMSETEKKQFPQISREKAVARINMLLEREAKVFKIAQGEYADSPNIFANFNRIADRLGLSPEKVLMVYAMKHVDGIASWINGNEEHRESIEGRIMDLRIYMAILFLMVIVRKAGNLDE